MYFDASNVVLLFSSHRGRFLAFFDKGMAPHVFPPFVLDDVLVVSIPDKQEIKRNACQFERVVRLMREALLNRGFFL